MSEQRFDPCGNLFYHETGSCICCGAARCPHCLEIRRLRLEFASTHDLRARSVGWLVDEDEESITIAAHDGDDQVTGDITIPKVAITGRWEIIL